MAAKTRTIHSLVTDAAIIRAKQTNPGFDFVIVANRVICASCNTDMPPIPRIFHPTSMRYRCSLCGTVVTLDELLRYFS